MKSGYFVSMHWYNFAMQNKPILCCPGIFSSPNLHNQAGMRQLQWVLKFFKRKHSKIYSREAKGVKDSKISLLRLMMEPE